MTLSERLHYEQDDLWAGDETGLGFLPERVEAYRSLIPAAAQSLLEVGAGDGRVIRELAKVLPIDIRLAALERSGAAVLHVRVPAVQGSIDALPFRERSVDVVLCAEVLEHLPSRVFEKAVRELVRVACGLVIVSVPNRENRMRSSVRCAECGCTYNPDRHLRSFTPASMPSLLPGMSLTELVEVGPRAPVYPRRLRWALEKRGILVRPGSPTCPQCGARYSPAARPRILSQPGAGKPVYHIVSRSTAERLLPRRRHPYWLVGRYER